MFQTSINVSNLEFFFSGWWSKHQWRGQKNALSQTKVYLRASIIHLFPLVPGRRWMKVHAPTSQIPPTNRDLSPNSRTAAKFILWKEYMINPPFLMEFLKKNTIVNFTNFKLQITNPKAVHCKRTNYPFIILFVHFESPEKKICQKRYLNLGPCLRPIEYYCQDSARLIHINRFYSKRNSQVFLTGKLLQRIWWTLNLFLVWNGPRGNGLVH